MQLRPYQETAIEDIKKAFRKGNRCVCEVLPCRAGKSVIAAKIAKSATDKGNRVLFIVHRKELCQQISETFRQCGVNMWLCDVSMVQTVTRRLDTIAEPQLIITDEFHHCIAKTYTNIYERFPKALVLGFTATPVRLKEKGLGDICQKLVVGVEAQWLIDNKYMSDYDYFNNKLVDTDNLKVTAGEYNKKEMNALLDENIVFTGAVENYLKHANGKSAIVYCSDVANSKSVAEEFNQRGISAGHITGSQAKTEREKAMWDFRTGNIKILTSCEVISEGIDIADCECCILLRPTKSLSLFIQQSMRCLTYKEGKRAIILDLVGNYNNFGVPTQERKWDLGGGAKTVKNTRQCENCYGIYEKKMKECPYCGYVPTAKERQDSDEEKETAVAELEKVDKSVRIVSNWHDCKTFDDLCAFRKHKKYKWGWEFHKAKELKIEVPEKYQQYQRVRKQKSMGGYYK